MRRRTGEQRGTTAASVLIAGAWLAALALAAAAGAEGGDGDGASIVSVDRTVRRFDFEEGSLAPLELPLHFYREPASDRGFPPFGEVRLRDDQAVSGTWSLRFELEGGSMEAHTRRGEIPVLPMTDYLVTAEVRTAGLEHARARLVAWLHDRAGEIIPSSRTSSELVRTEGSWRTLRVRVPGQLPEAADLVVALQVLQPAQYADARESYETPLLEDVRGLVWFDDVVVRHHPTIELTTGHPDGTITLPDAPRLHLEVDDLARDALTGELTVLDIDGRAVFHRDDVLSGSGRKRTVTLPIDECGWYRAIFSLRNRSGPVAQREVEFTVLSGSGDDREAGASRLGVHVPATAADRLATLPMMIDRLGARTVIMTVTSPDAAPVGSPTAAADRALLESLRDRDVAIILAPGALPAGGGEATDAAALADRSRRLHDEATWRAFFDDLMMSFGHVARGWRLPGAEVIGPAHLPEIAAAAQRALTISSPGQRLYAPWPVEQTPPIGDGPGVELEVPYHVRPESLLDYGSVAGAAPLAIALEPLPVDRYDLRHRVTDLMLRVLHAWRTDVPLITTTAPWSWRGGDRGAPMIDPVFAAWRTLDRQLAGRTFVGTLDLERDLHCWLLAGADGRSAALVAWRDGAVAGGRTTRAVLAAGPVQRVDAFGNRRPVVADDMGHAIAIGTTPVFIEGIDLQLARFRAGFRIDPPFAAAMHRVHEHAIVLSNPWQATATGTIRLGEGDQWRISPRVQTFTIEAGGTVRLPIDLVMNRKLLAGTKRIEATIAMLADQPYELALSTSLEIGLEDIELSTRWKVDIGDDGRRDLVITHVVTNHGEKPVGLSAYVLAPEVPIMRRPIGELGTHTTAVRTFHIENGATLLAGREIRVGLTEMNGAARLNRVMRIPEGIGE